MSQKIKTNKPTERQIEVNKLYYELGCNSSAVAKKLGITVTGVNKTLFYGAKNGLPLTPDKYSPVAPAGWSSTFKTVQYNKKGVVQIWDRVKPDEMGLDQMMKILEKHTPVLSDIIPGPKNYRKDLMLEWKLFDQHHTLHSWGKQTGADYSIKHSEFLIKSAASKIFAEHGPVDTCVLCLGGDNMHVDNRSNVTEKSGHHLDTDSRYQKGLETFCFSIVFSIDLALIKARYVNVKVVSGNHDWHSAIAIALILRAHYRKNPRVEIDVSPMEHKFFRWGNQFFMYSHGDQAPAERYANYAKDYVLKNDITGIRKINVRVGHFHKKQKVRTKDLDSFGIASVEYFDTLAAPDAYAAGASFSSTRATTTDIFHKKWGKRGGMELTAGELLENFK